MGTKVTFNPTTRIIEMTQAPVLINGEWIIELDVRNDLYSDGKEDWINDDDLTKFRFPIRAVGGDLLSGNKRLGVSFFLHPSWKIRPYEATHRFIIRGNLYSEDGTSVVIPTIGNYNVLLEQDISLLPDPLSAIDSTNIELIQEKTTELILFLENVIKGRIRVNSHTGVLEVWNQ